MKRADIACPEGYERLGFRELSPEGCSLFSTLIPYLKTPVLWDFNAGCGNNLSTQLLKVLLGL